MVSFYEFDEEQKKIIVKRTKDIQQSIDSEHGVLIPPVSWLYLVEARMCYIHGMDVSCIIMLIMTFEELFRTILSFEGTITCFDNKKIKVDDLRSNELFELAKARSWITKTEYVKLEKFRRLRNKFTHVKDARNNKEKRRQDEIYRQSMTAEFLMPSVDFDGLAEEAIRLLPIFFKVLNKNSLPEGLHLWHRK